MTSPRILAVADTDSYLKWSAATLAALPHSWRTGQLVIANPAMPSPAQRRAALPDAEHPVEVVMRRELARRIRDERPEVVLLACTGPTVAALAADRVLTGPSRPVLLTGLPGISVPATRRAVMSRAHCDLFVLHSHREVEEFAELGARWAPGLRFGLARLPFLDRPTSPEPVIEDRVADHTAPDGPAVGPGSVVGRRRVFAAQAKVPADRAQREQILLALAAAGGWVVKLRADGTEQQTHREDFPYPALYADLVRDGRIAPTAISFVTGSMAEALRTATGFATVSSTAALEAMVAGVPTTIIADFGVSAAMINLVFEGSGCLGSLSEIVTGDLREPSPGWLAENYLHPAGHDTWLEQLDALVDARSTGTLPARQSSRQALATRVRGRVRLIVPSRLWPAVRRGQRRWRGLRRRLRPRPDQRHPAPPAPDHTVRAPHPGPRTG